jgi:hypothetical protein
MSCPYAKILGERNKGFHSTRLFDFAVYDTLATIVLAYVISIFTSYTFTSLLIFLFILGEILHYIFGVNTKVLEVIGLSPIC